VGEDAKSTIIIGAGGVERGANAVIEITADKVKISGFTIESLNYSSASYYATGINIQGDHATITGNIIQKNYFGIFCSIQSYTKISENTITANLKDGIRFLGSSYNDISENKITGNGVSGIALEGYLNTISKNKIENNYRGIGFGSSYSVIFGNVIVSNIESGIFFAGSQNIISSNDFQENKWGIFITSQLAASYDNTFYYNNFLNKSFSAFDNSSLLVETWDNGPQLGGNYWSDYLSKYPNATQTSTSGIGNTPYLICSNNTDNSPLLTQYDTSNLGNAPSLKPAPTAAPNSLVASWSFDTIESNRVTPDSTGKNPATLGSITVNRSYTPRVVEGKFGKALSFDGHSYVNVPPSLSLENSKETTVDAWINIQSLKEGVAYNNIFVECARTINAVPTRTLGLAINGEVPQNASSPLVGALRAYVFTENGGFNEIATKESVVSLNQWIHVVFTRSLTTGMHIYVDGKEQAVYVTFGEANPTGAITRQNEIYIGHDAICTIDELQISNMVDPLGQPFWMQWWLWTAIIFAGVAGSGLLLYFKKHVKGTKIRKINSSLRAL
jgi:parallel beta-helix repeat protein